MTVWSVLLGAVKALDELLFRRERMRTDVGCLGNPAPMMSQGQCGPR